MRRKLVVGNWKMNPVSMDGAVDLARAVARMDGGDVEVGVAPSYLALAPVRQALSGSAVRIFAQNVHWEVKGAYTGGISAPMIVGLADGSIVGHSEVRRDDGDDDARVAARANAALAHELRVIFCLGESLSERRAGRTDEVLRRQVRDGIGAVDARMVTPQRFAIAYEPIWAIGTGEAATCPEASAAIGVIRGELRAIGLPGDELTVMYGGSVSAANCGEFADGEGVDGALVGGASLKPEEFAKIVDAFR